jgi:DNA-binding IclR family transcriptional regulator
MGKTEDNSSRAVLRALSILETVAQRNRGLTNSEISRKLEIPKSTASYILHALETKGYLSRDKETNKYRLGLKLISLSQNVLTHLDLRDIALPQMQHFVDRAKLSAHLAIVDRGRAVYIEKVESLSFVRMDTWIGKRMPVHATAVGKVLVSRMSEDVLDAILKERGMDKLTPKTITSRTKFHHEIEKVREQGFAIDDEESSVGARCVAAPIFNAEGVIIAAVGTSGSTVQIDNPHLHRVIELVKETARKISTQLGYHARLNKG